MRRLETLVASLTMLFAAACASSSGSSTPSTGCKPGTTQECTGPGACKGGQSCPADGLAWSACDCGGGAAGKGGATSSGPGGVGGGAGKATACTDVTFNKPSCDTCAHASCCPDITSCLADNGCNTLVACVRACGDSACSNACISSNTAGATKFGDTIAACIGGSGACASACNSGAAGSGGSGGSTGTGGSGPPDQTIVSTFTGACHDCLATMSGVYTDVGGAKTDCGTVAAACGAHDEKCSTEATCIEAYQTAHPKDSLNCAVDKCIGVSPEANDFFVCASVKCGAPCDLAVGFPTAGCGM